MTTTHNIMLTVQCLTESLVQLSVVDRHTAWWWWWWWWWWWVYVVM